MNFRIPDIMLQKPVILLILMGIAIGLFTGILDSAFHFINYERFRAVNIIVFLIFFIGVYSSVIFYRNNINNGIITYGNAFRKSLMIGIIAALIISLIRFVFLEYVINLDINSILDNTRVSINEQNVNLTEEQIYNRLSFIEFSYNPIVSSILYFGYYFMFVVVFTFFASFVIKKVDRNISL